MLHFLHHLWFDDLDYRKKGNLIKWNPAVKTTADRDKLWQALLDDRIDVVATDHAPHTLEEKHNSLFKHRLNQATCISCNVGENSGRKYYYRKSG